LQAIAYSDPNCPYCYATEERLHLLGLADRVAWRGVQHAPHLPAPMGDAEPQLRAELSVEVAAVRRLAPEIEITLPRGKPNTAPAIGRAAAALRVDPAAGRRLVRALYRAFWIDGADLSDEQVLAQLTASAGLEQVTEQATDAATVQGWQTEWEWTGLGGVPLLLRADRRPLYGLVPAAELEAFLR
jgi:predicted DsbA family dithiol-disulfide isomerase